MLWARSVVRRRRLKLETPMARSLVVDLWRDSRDFQVSVRGVSASLMVPSGLEGNWFSPDSNWTGQWIWGLSEERSGKRGGWCATHQVKIQVIRAQVLQRLVERLLHILGLARIVPELAGQEDLLTGHTRGLNTSTDLSFVVVNRSSITNAHRSANRTSNAQTTPPQRTYDDNPPSAPTRQHSSPHQAPTAKSPAPQRG